MAAQAITATGMPTAVPTMRPRCEEDSAEFGLLELEGEDVMRMVEMIMDVSPLAPVAWEAEVTVEKVGDESELDLEFTEPGVDEEEEEDDDDDDDDDVELVVPPSPDVIGTPSDVVGGAFGVVREGAEVGL